MALTMKQLGQARIRSHAMAAIAVAASLLAGVTARAADTATDDTQLASEMREFVGRFVAAYESGDVEQMRPLYLPDAMIWGHNRPTAIGWEGIREFFALSFSRFDAKVKADVLHVERRGDRVALYTLARVDLAPKAQGAGPLRVWFRDLIILARGPSGWLIETNVDQPTTEALYEADLARLPFRRTAP